MTMVTVLSSMTRCSLRWFAAIIAVLCCLPSCYAIFEYPTQPSFPDTGNYVKLGRLGNYKWVVLHYACGNDDTGFYSCRGMCTIYNNAGEEISSAFECCATREETPGFRTIKGRSAGVFAVDEDTFALSYVVQRKINDVEEVKVSVRGWKYRPGAPALKLWDYDVDEFESIASASVKWDTVIAVNGDYVIVAWKVWYSVYAEVFSLSSRTELIARWLVFSGSNEDWPVVKPIGVDRFIVACQRSISRFGQGFLEGLVAVISVAGNTVVHQTPRPFVALSLQEGSQWFSYAAPKPNVVAMGDDKIVAVWAHHAEGSNIEAEVRSASGVRLHNAPVRLNTGTYGTQTAPDVAWLGENYFVVAWNEQSPSGYFTTSNVFEFDAASRTISPVHNEFRVRGTGNSKYPSVMRLGTFGEQSFVVTWSGTASIFGAALVSKTCPEGQGTPTGAGECQPCSAGYWSPEGSAFCLNVNECANPAATTCSTYAKCRDNDGSYTCTCEPDYRDVGTGDAVGQGTACEEILCTDGGEGCRVLVSEGDGLLLLPTMDFSLNFTVSMMIKLFPFVSGGSPYHQIIRLSSNRALVINYDWRGGFPIIGSNQFWELGFVFPDRWYHIVWVSEISMAGEHTDTVYIDGKSKTKSTSLTETGILTFDESWIGGDGSTGPFNYRKGWTDDVKLWTRALRPSEWLQAGYSAAEPAEALMAWWPFTAPSLGQAATVDAVGGYNAVFQGGEFTSKYDSKWLVKDECALESHNCHANAICHDTVSSFSCVCDGFVDDGPGDDFQLGLSCGLQLEFHLDPNAFILAGTSHSGTIARCGASKFVAVSVVSNDLVAEIYNIAGAVVVPSFTISETGDTYSKTDVEVSVSEIPSTDTFLVFWKQSIIGVWTESAIELMAAVVNGETGEIETEFIVAYSEGEHGGPFQIDVAVAEDGTLVMAYTATRASGNVQDVYCQIYSSAGAQLVPEFRVNLEVFSHQNYPNVEYLGADRFIVTYEVYRGRYMTVFSLFDKSGTFIVQDETPSPAMPNQPAMARISDTAFVLSSAMSFQVFSSEDGTALTELVVAGSAIGSLQAQYSLTAVSPNTFVLAWATQGGQGGNHLYAAPYARVYVFANGTADAISGEFRIAAFGNIAELIAIGDMQTEVKFLAAWRADLGSGFGTQKFGNIFTMEAPAFIVDECAVDKDNCHLEAVCTDTIESFRCDCNAGYFGDGVVCNADELCLTDFQCHRNPATCVVGLAPGPCHGDFMDGWVEGGATCAASSPCEGQTCVELDFWGQNNMLCCDGSSVEAGCLSPRCEQADAEQCFQLLRRVAEYPLQIHSDADGRAFFFPPMFDCLRQLSMQSVFGGVASPFPVSSCETCIMRAGQYAAYPGLCFSPEHLLRTTKAPLDVWWPAYTGSLPQYTYSMLVDIGQVDTVDAIQWRLSSKAPQTILSFTIHLGEELETIEGDWAAAYDTFVGLHVSAPDEWIPIDLVAPNTQMEARTVLGEVSKLPRQIEARYILLQLTTTGQPIVEAFKALPPFPLDKYCSQGTGVAVCACPSGFYGSGQGPTSCSSESWSVSVKVSIPWATQEHIDGRFANVAEWTDYERVLWQVLLGESTDDTSGSNVPHYFVSSMRVSVMEASPGEFIASMFPLFKDNATATIAAKRLVSYLEDGGGLMAGTVVHPGPQVLAWNALESRDCDAEEVASGGGSCEGQGVCSDSSGDFVCECESGLGIGVRCSPLQECELGHENCHINELCVLSCDLDECVEQLHDCHIDGVCINTRTGWDCECASGFGGNGTHCEDVDECTEEAHDCQHGATCNNTVGGWECYCGAGRESVTPGAVGSAVQCESIFECDLGPLFHNCHSDALCTDTDDSFLCSCNSGYTGTGVTCADVDECVNGTHTCDTHADCNNTKGEYNCDCKPGWSGTGLVCTDINECAAGPCSIDATCSNSDGSFSCNCRSGYAGNGIECEDIDECEYGLHDCDGTALCSNLVPGFTCGCVDGWSPVGDGRSCQDVDECAAAESPCSSDANCSNAIGSFSCTCNAGFDGNGVHCLDLGTCATLRCIEEAECGLVDGGWGCVCRFGYTGDGDWCQADECVLGTHDCHHHAECQDLLGGFLCTCERGFEGNGSACVDTNECSPGGLATARCAAEADCSNTAGSFACSCPAGYSDNSPGYDLGVACNDVDECSEAMDNCDAMASCFNTRGSFTCACPDGFTDDSGLGIDCRNLDECREGAGAAQCDDSARCVDQYGSFNCVCYQGFQGDGITCQDLNECLEHDTNDCHADAQCSNTVGGYTCACVEGYEGNGTSCADVNECETGEFDCEANSECINELGGYACQCANGFLEVLTDGVVGCQDDDECEFGSDNCHKTGAQCHNTDGSFTCNCSVGWTGDGVNCTDDDECEEYDDEMLCPGEAFCINTPGSFVCECSLVSGSKLLINGTCLDVDECLSSEHNCHRNATCNNTDGSFECQCAEGWYGDGVSCQDLNECELPGEWDGNYHNCQDFAVCTNTEGSFTCGCEVGTGGANCSEVFCPAGMLFINGTKSCGDCLPGSFSEAGSSSCETCPAHTYAPLRSPECTPCPSGFRSFPGSSTCNMIEVDTGSSCPECTFLFLKSGADRALYRLGSCDTCFHLDLSHQGITWIVGAFDGMQQLQTLDLSWNEIRRVSRQTFQDLQNLELLNLDGNRLQMVSEGEGGTVVNGTSVFVDLINLDELRISEQRPSGIFASLPVVGEILASLARTGPGALTELDLSFNHVKFLEERDGPEERRANRGSRPAGPLLDDLQKLSISGNVIGILEPGMLNIPNLIDLSLADTSITELADHAFEDLPQLLYLHIGDNPFRKILKTDTFVGLGHLETLNVSNNKIFGIEAGAFAPLKKLRELHITHNLLTHTGPYALPLQSFRGLPLLEHMDLSHNPWLGSIQQGLLASLPSLRKLLIRQPYFGLFSIEDGAFDELSALQLLDLSGSSLGALRDDTFSALSNLEILDLSANEVERLSAAIFANLSKLESLLLADNDILWIDDSAFDGMPQLRVLNLSGNFLMDFPSAISPISRSRITVDVTHFPDHGFAALPLLQELDVSRNQLSSVRAAWFAGLSALKNLSLAFNRISQVEPGTFQDMALLEELDLQGNHYNPVFYDDPEHHRRETYWRQVEVYDGDATFTRGGSAVAYAASQQDTLQLMRAKYMEYASKFTENAGGGRAPRFVSEWGPLTLSADTLQGLSALKILRLSHCGLRAIPPGAFDSLESLTALHLDWNFIQGVTDTAFSHLSQLQDLRILQRGPSCDAGDDDCWNPLVCVPGDADARGVITDVQWPMPICPANSIVLLGCKGCHFEIHNGTTLSRTGACDFCPFMDLSTRGIVVFESGTFAEIQEARQLDLGNNMLSQLDDAAFEPLAQLQTLILKDNLLTSLSERAFKGLGKLRLLDLSGNMLAHIADGSFAMLHDLERLLLGSHRLKQIDIAVFGLPTALGYLDISKYEVFRAWTDSLTVPKGIIHAKTAFMRPNGTQVSWSNQINALQEVILEGLGMMALPQFGLLNETLRTLDLSGNQLVELAADNELGGLTKLRKLLLNGNIIRSVASGAFRGLSSLSNLSLASNKLESLPQGALDGLDSIAQLDLAGNQFQRFEWEVTWPVNAFQVDVTRQLHPSAPPDAGSTLECLPLFPRLLHCRTAECLASAPVPNRAEDSDVDFASPGSVFEDLGSEVDGQRLRLCGFEGFDTCPGCTFWVDGNMLRRDGECSIACKAFDFKGKGIAAVDPAAMQGMDFVRMLILSDNELTGIDSDTFADMVRLEVLDLSRNAIASISDRAFGPLRGLKHLHLGRNALTSITSDLLAGQVSLEFVDLQQNAITSIADGSLVLPALRSLRLSQNSISFDALASGMSANNARLVELELDGNVLGVVSASTFDQAPNLRFLNLSTAGVTEIGANAFQALSKLRRLRLDGNTIASVVENTFAGLEELRELDMHNSEVEELTGGSFRGVPRLEVLQLQGNSITVFPEGALPTILDMSLVVDLSNNKLSSVEAESFDDKHRFRLLNLTHNKLRALEPGSMPQADEVLVFKGNYLLCLPTFDTATVLIDWEYARLPRGASYCLPGACPVLVSTFMRVGGDESSDTPSGWDLTHGVILRGIEKLTSILRSDVSTMFDDYHLQQFMYVNRGRGKRQWCAPVRAPYQPRLANCASKGVAGNPCRTCPANHYCPGANQSIPCPPKHKAPPGSESPSDCFICVEGEYLLQGVCVDCQEGFWCRDGAKHRCPPDATCPAKASQPTCNDGFFLDDEGTACKDLFAAPAVEMVVLIPYSESDFRGALVRNAFQRAVASAAEIAAIKVTISKITAAVSHAEPGDAVEVAFSVEVVTEDEGAELASSGKLSVESLNAALDAVGLLHILAVKSLPKGTGSECHAVDSKDQVCALLSYTGGNVVLTNHVAQECGGEVDCTCAEEEASICHALGFCTRTTGTAEVPTGEGLVAVGSRAANINGTFRCSCPSDLLGHGYGPDGCDTKGYAVRVVFRGKQCLAGLQESNLLALLGNLNCTPGSNSGCDHVHYTDHGDDLGVNVLFHHSAAGKLAAEAAAAAFNNYSDPLRRSGVYPPQVDPLVGAAVYVWNAGTTGAAIPALPSGMQVQGVHFEPWCARTGCWVIDVIYTTGSSDVLLETFNTFYLPYAVGSDALSYDYSYMDHGILDSFEPANFPCRVSDYVAADGSVGSLPVQATGCCFGTAFDENNTDLGGDGNGTGLLGNYRATEAFASYAATVYPQLCPGGYDSPNIDQVSPGNASTPRPEDLFPNGAKAGNHNANSFLAAGTKFKGMPHSPGITWTTALDAFVGLHAATIKLDAQELRNGAGLLRGSVGVEHTVDFFIGFANFKPATSTWILDSLATQAAVHVEKTSFFSVSTHGVNDYTFVEYINLRLVAIYNEDKDFSGAEESDERTVRTNTNDAAQYVQVTFTLGSQYAVNTNSGLVPLDSVRVGEGIFLAETQLDHKCLEWTAAAGRSFPEQSSFNHTLQQDCSPAASMCASPASIEDSFVVFNIPLGVDFFDPPSEFLTNNIFVSLVISAVDTVAQASDESPNEGSAPFQLKTTLSAAVPVVQGGINIFCDGITAKTDLKDVANADIILGSASSLEELTRLRIIENVASSQLDVRSAVEINTDSIEAGLMTLVLKGNSSYFGDNGNVNTRGVSLELEDVITLHFMEADGVAADGSGSQGKQGAVRALLAAASEDNSNNITGLNTDGYSLNGAFYFTVDRAAQRGHLEPSENLRDLCPATAGRPAETGGLVMETCVMRRDVRYRDYPWRSGAVSTAMEISHTASETPLTTTSDESMFLTSILGDSEYSRQLAVDFANSVDSRYDLNGRYRRAYWINPGYEWAPTQTGGASTFQLSQKLMLFALVTLDERVATTPGQSIFGDGDSGAPEDVNSDGASEPVPNRPRVPAARRRALLSVDPQTGDGAVLSAAQITFPVSLSSTVAAVYGVPAGLVATFSVRMRLTGYQACMSRKDLQKELASVLDPLVAEAGGVFKTVQVTSLTVSAEGAGCDANLRRSEPSASADVGMMVVFADAASARLDLAVLAANPSIERVVPMAVSNEIAVELDHGHNGDNYAAFPTPEPAPKDAAGMSTAVIIGGICGGVAAAVLAGAVLLMRRRSSMLRASRAYDSPLSSSGLEDGNSGTGHASRGSMAALLVYNKNRTSSSGSFSELLAAAGENNQGNMNDIVI